MLAVIPTSPPGVTAGAEALIKLIEENPDELIQLFQVERHEIEPELTTEYSFIALFREKGTIGQFVAFVNEWGTNFGARAGGTGSAVYREMQSFIEDCEIHPCTIQWDSIAPELHNRLTSKTSRYTRYRAWKELLIEELADVMYEYLDAPDYPINENWKKRD